MASTSSFACLWLNLQSLQQGLAPSYPSARSHTGGSPDLMDFYATSYAVAYGQPHFHPYLHHHTGTTSGYVTNSHSGISCLLCPPSAAEGHCQDITTSTTAEHFKPFWLLDGRSLLPHSVHQAGSGYSQETPISCLHTTRVSPQQMGVLQGPPKRCKEHGIKNCHTNILEKTTKKQSGFTRAIPSNNITLPALPGQPV
ncbi:PPR32 phosphatase, partial [Galbula dea]|nr:PPR32 phosphatase [Galbula dea]